jgi:hypothetical protein
MGLAVCFVDRVSSTQGMRVGFYNLD